MKPESYGLGKKAKNGKIDLLWFSSSRVLEHFVHGTAPVRSSVFLIRNVEMETHIIVVSLRK